MTGSNLAWLAMEVSAVVDIEEKIIRKKTKIESCFQTRPAIRQWGQFVS